MRAGRRNFLSQVAMLAGAAEVLQAAQRQRPPVVVPQSPIPSGQSGPPDDSTMPPPPDPKAQLKQSQKDLRRDADRLLQAAKDLKDEADKTEQTDVLSLTLVHKAEEVEKLARHIKDLVRAS